MIKSYLFTLRHFSLLFSFALLFNFFFIFEKQPLFQENSLIFVLNLLQNFIFFRKLLKFASVKVKGCFCAIEVIFERLVKLRRLIGSTLKHNGVYKSSVNDCTRNVLPRGRLGLCATFSYPDVVLRSSGV
jgi:hypothetical protein